MSVVVFDVAKFRVDFPQFANPTNFSNSTLEGYFDSATCIINDENYGLLEDRPRTRALYLLTAHLAALSVIIAGGETPGMVNSASIDKISVSLTPPPLPNQWQWWLGLTPYGQQLLALLQAQSVGGFYVGGWPERAAFRKAFGVF